MQRTPREREQRTLSAHLECRDVFVGVRNANPGERRMANHFLRPRLYGPKKTCPFKCSCQDLI